jgi:hypothetical protein
MTENQKLQKALSRNSLLIFRLFFCTINNTLQPSIIDTPTMMPDTKKLVPRSLQPKLHSRAQIRFGVLLCCDPFLSLE